MLSLGQAAKEVGVAKSTISKAIKDGRLSAEKLDNGSYKIDPSELFRVYQPNRSKETSNGPSETPKDNLELLVENKVMQRELEFMRERLEERDKQLQKQAQKAEEELSEARSDRDHWRAQATMILTDHRPPKGFIERVFGLWKTRKSNGQI
ncbi:hypothetical protein [Ruegeria lacuscaerulensis]|uniref:hypothetical protein n=1 Tax=Ruegeria lacuscaerulensis TaxID=55218 RepID=UPI00147C40F1|nr:hypothetical protein [Ruegeria lacuscaerulensis]